MDVLMRAANTDGPPVSRHSSRHAELLHLRRAAGNSRSSKTEGEKGGRRHSLTSRTSLDEMEVVSDSLDAVRNQMETLHIKLDSVSGEVTKVYDLVDSFNRERVQYSVREDLKQMMTSFQTMHEQAMTRQTSQVSASGNNQAVVPQFSSNGNQAADSMPKPVSAVVMAPGGVPDRPPGSTKSALLPLGKGKRRPPVVMVAQPSMDDGHLDEMEEAVYSSSALKNKRGVIMPYKAQHVQLKPSASSLSKFSKNTDQSKESMEVTTRAASKSTHNTVESYDESQEHSEDPRPRRASLSRSMSGPTVRLHGSMGSGSSDLMQEVFEALNRVRERTEAEKIVWSFLEDPDLVFGGRFFMRLMAIAIFCSALIPVLDSISPPPVERNFSDILESVLDVIFAIEVIVRFVCCPNRLTFLVNIYNLMDICAVGLSVFIRSFSPNAFTISLVEADAGDSSLLSLAICALPVARLLKILRRFDSFHLILTAFRHASEALPVLLYILFVLVLVFASVIFIVEDRENVPTLTKSLWLTIVTVGTIGYGDIVPETPEGGVVVSILVIVSALYMAIPIGIVGKAFSAVWDDRDRLLIMYRTRSRFLSRGYKAKDVPAMFFNFDTDGDGQLTLEEFLAMMTQLQIEISGARLVELFSQFDADGSGAIDDHEFVKTLFPDAYAEIYSGLQDAECEEILEAAADAAAAAHADEAIASGPSTASAA